jgi:membrane-associated phospholipid phosphatase
MLIDKILEIDQNLSRRLLLSEDKEYMRKFASFFAHSGDSWFLEIGLFLIWIFTKGKWHSYSALFAGAIVIQAVLVIAIKFLIKRRRPEGDCISFGLGIHLLGWIFLLWGICVSFARVSLGVHYLIDIIAGWVIGIILAKGILAAQSIFYQLFPFAF